MDECHLRRESVGDEQEAKAQTASKDYEDQSDLTV